MDREYFVYQYVTPDEMYYFGVTKDIKERCRKNHYKLTTLQPYIEKYGWKNLQHNILMRELTYEEALKSEDMLIRVGLEDGVCINKKRSGFIETKDKLEYDKRYRKENKEKLNEYQRRYREEHREKIKLYHKEYRNKKKKESSK